MNQIALPLDWPAAENEQDFIVSASNELAVRHLTHWGLWPVMITILTGPRKSGRSFLGRLFAQKGGDLIDEAERADEEALFHAWNRAQAERKPLLLIADAVPPLWSPVLPDLRSRIAATPVIRIDEPDDAMVPALCERLLVARGLAPAPGLGEWLARRIERSYLGIHRAIDAIDAAAWQRKGKVGTPMAREALIAAGVMEDSQSSG
jgi:chromosomal replication initiation ATPase DnaA